MASTIKEAQKQIDPGTDKVPLAPSLFSFFTENKGQWSEDIDFLAKTQFGTAEFNSNGFFYCLSGLDAGKQLVAFKFIGSNDVKPVGIDQQQNTNFISDQGSLPSTMEAANYREIVYSNLWDGVDLYFLFSEGCLKYEFHIAPYSNEDQIRIAVQGAALSTKEGALMLTTAVNTIIDGSLSVYYACDGQALNASFSIASNEFSFNVHDRDMAKELVIDPLVYSTYVCGSYGETTRDMAIDGAGAAYVTGATGSTMDFPVTPFAFNTTHWDNSPNHFESSIYVFKLNPAGTDLEYSTFINGSGIAYGIAVDSVGCAYVTGYTGGGLPTTANAFNRVFQGSQDAFALKLSVNGRGLLYSTYIGGSGSDTGQKIAVNSTGEAYVVGWTQSADFNVTVGAYNTTLQGTQDAFVLGLNPSGSKLDYSTFLGGNGEDKANCIALDSSGNVYVTGDVSSNNFPVTPGAVEKIWQGGYSDAFVTEFNPQLSSLVFSTYFGGYNADHGDAIATDGYGNTYVTGMCNSDNLPVTSGAFQTHELTTAPEIMFFELNRTGGLIYSTFLSGSVSASSAFQISNGISVDASGNAYITGMTGMSDFPTTPDAFQKVFLGTVYNGCAFVSKIHPAGTGASDLVYSTYIGGISEANAIKLDPSGYVAIAGDCFGGNFNVTGGSYNTVGTTNNWDTFVSKISLPSGTPPGAPTGVMAFHPGLNNATINWTAPADTGTSSLSGFNVYYGTTATPATRFGSMLSATTLSVNVTALLPNTQYYFVVKAVSAAGEGSGSSPAATATTTNVVPGVPVFDSATPGNAQVILIWHAGTDNGSPITGYKVYRNATVSPVYTGTSTTFTDGSLINGVLYTYTVVAVNLQGDGPASGGISATPDVVPNAPTGVTVSLPTLTSIRVDWTAPVANGGTPRTGYDVFYGTSATPTTKFGSTLGASATYVVVTGLLPNTQYNFTVKAINVFGSSAASSPVATATTTNVVPGSPMIGTAIPGLSSVVVSWSAPTNSGSPITDYRVYYGKTAGPTLVYVTALSTATNTIVNGLDPGAQYFFNVVAVNAAGAGAASSDASATTTDALPGAPVIDSALAGNHSATVTWDAGPNTGSPVTAFKLYRNGTVSPIYTGLLLTFTDTALVNGVDYSYSVVATNLMGDSASSNTVHSMPNVVPGVPAIAISSTGLNSVTVSWNTPYNAGSVITGYKVYYGTSASPASTFVTALASDNQLVVSGLSAATLYYFSIEAMNAAGGSAASGDASTTTTDVVPTAPVVGTVTPHLNSVTLAWDAPTANGGSPVTGYDVFVGSSSTATMFGSILSAGTRTVEVTGLSAATSYYFHVVAVNAMGSGPASVDVFANTTDIVPGAPSGVSVGSPTLNSITVNWTAPAGNGGTPITGYDVFYGTSPDPTTRFGGTLGPSSRSVNVTSLLPNTLYYFEVKALNAAGSSAVLLYNVSGSTTDVVPGAPTGVTVTPGLRNLTLNWTVPSQNGGSSITGYHIYLVGSTGNSLVGNTTSETRYVISNLTPGSNLTYLITAVNVKGESAPSISVNGAALYPPEAPVDVKVVRDGSAILLTWNLTNGNASSLPTLGYAIYRGTSSGGEILIATVGASTTSYSDVNTSTSQTYYYRIGAVPGPGTVVDPQSMSPEVVQNGQTNGTDWTLIGGGVILLIALFLILFLVLISRRKKKKKEEGDPTKR